MTKIHFIGIGGIGISALARFLHKQGYIISGSDMKESNTTNKLKNDGININIPHHENAINNQNLIIYSAAIKNHNVEIKKAQKLGIKCINRSEALKFILKDKQVYAIAGAHGKSTTSAILANLLESSAILGAICKNHQTNMIYKDDKKIVFEADESDGSFLNSNPYLGIVTNTEPEHMEYYNYDYDKFYNSYKEFINKCKIKVINLSDPYLEKLNLDAIKLDPKNDIKDIKTKIINYEPYISFKLKNLGEFEVRGIGEYIAIDASLAILAAMSEKNIEQIRKNIKNYKGIKKRFDIVQKNENFVIIDDYAHHPTEIKATLTSAIEYAKKIGFNEVHVIWQPHKYTRVKSNLNEFKSCFKDANSLLILPVYASGEDEIKINFKEEFKSCNPSFANFIKTDENGVYYNDKLLNKGVIIGFGAGDITYQLRGKK